MADDEPFASRWSRRKGAARQQPADDTAPAESDRTGMPDAEPEEPVPLTAEDLPDIDTLDAESDYRVFMRDNVPEDLRARALHRLWRSSPLFSGMDLLDDYAEDFTDAALVLKEGITSAYKVGRGYATEAADDTAGETPGEDVAPTAAEDPTVTADAEPSPEEDTDAESDAEHEDENEAAEEMRTSEPAADTEPPVEKT